nr:MAG TPA: hypothetical protein [Caudoviricetes sp.]
MSACGLSDLYCFYLTSVITLATISITRIAW